jgi:F1F0 ATPase subunit 2
MQPVAMISLGVIVGTLVGLVHFGGLAWTVRRFVDGGRPGVVALSLLVRMAVTAAVVIGVALVAPLAVLGIIPGVIAARVILTQQARRGGSNPIVSNGLNPTHIDGIGDG